jgi:hypothetical protein
VSFAKLTYQTVGGYFLFLPKSDGCQVGLPNYWSCSERGSIWDERPWLHTNLLLTKRNRLMQNISQVLKRFYKKFPHLS